MSAKFPRTSERLVVIAGDVWNDLAEEVERLGHWNVAAPLQLIDGPGGFGLAVKSSISSPFVLVRILDDEVKFTDPDTAVVTTVTLGGGKYLGRIISGNYEAPAVQADLEAPLDVANEGFELTETESAVVADADALIYNLDENELTTAHALLAGADLYVRAYDTGVSAALTIGGQARTFRILEVRTLNTICS